MSESKLNPVELFLAMKDTSELMVDLAYSALLYDDKRIATEVHYLDEEMAELHYMLQKLAVDGVAAICHPDMEMVELVSPDRALALLRLGGVVEKIASAARSIADVTLRDIDPHPVLGLSLQDSDSTVIRVQLVAETGGEIEDNEGRDGEQTNQLMVGPANYGKSLRALNIGTRCGLWVLAIRRNGRWRFDIKHTDVLEKEDILLLRGPVEGLEPFKEVMKGDMDDRPTYP